MKGAAVMDLDHSPFYLQDGNGGGPRLHVDNGSMRNIEERLLSGFPDVEDLGMNINNKDDKAKILEVLGRTEDGRKKAIEIFGRDVWGRKSIDQGPSHDDPLGIGIGGNDGDDNDNRMFMDLVNDDNDVDHHSGDGKDVHNHNNNNNPLMADSLESERNEVDMLLDDD
jgi:histone demethylase JARID1